MTQQRRRIVFFLSFSAVAAILRFFHLETQSLWNDEMFSFDVANTPLGEIQSKLITHYHHPPFFFYLIHFAVQVFGQHAWALRLVSAISGSLTIGLVYFIASKYFDERAGLCAGLLCLVSPFHLAYSQEGRPYALAGLLTLLSFYFLILLMEKQSAQRVESSTFGGRWKLLYVFTLTALLYTHHWGIFVAASHVIFILLFAPQKKMFAALWLVAGILYVPEAFALMQQAHLSLVDVGRQATTHDRSGWFWVEYSSVEEIVNLGLAFSGSYFKMASSVFDTPLIVKFIGGLTVSVVGLNAVRLAARKNESIIVRGVFICFATTLLIPFVISFVRPEIFLWYRYTVIAFPLFCIFVGITAAQKTLKLGTVTATLLILVSLYGSIQYYSWQKANVKEVAIYVTTVAENDVRFIVRPKYFSSLLNYYYKGNIMQVDEAYLDSPLGRMVDTAKVFVYVSLDVPNTIRDYFDKHFDKRAERRFPGEAHMGMVVGVYRQKLSNHGL